MGISILIMLAGCILAGIMVLLHNMSSNQMEEIKDGAIPLEKVMPIQSIENDFIVNGNGDITAGYEIFLPEVFTLNEQARKQFILDLEGICKMLPSGTIIHQQLNFYTAEYENKNVGEVQNFIQRENLLHYMGRPILQSASYLYITFSDQGETKNLRNVQSSLLRKKNIPYAQPYKNIQKRLNEIEGYMINFEDGLRGMQNVLTNKMNNEKLNNKIFDFLNCSYDTPTSDATKRAVSPMFVTEDGDLKIGENHIAVLSLVEEGAVLYPFNKKPKITGSDSEIQMPKNIESKCSMTFPLGLGLPFAHTLNVVIEITDNDKTVTKLANDGRGLNPIINFYPPANEKKKNLQKFCDMITEENLQTAYTAVNIIIKDKSKESLQRKVSQGKNAFQNMNHSTCFVENAEATNIFFSNIPGNARSNYRGFVNTTAQALSYFMKESLYISDATGYVFLDRFGKPCIVDMMNSPFIVNKNRILIGPSGSGKSYWLNNYILQSITMMQDVVIIDIGGSYKSMINLNNGKYYDSRETSTFSFNPFLCAKDKKGNYVYYDATDADAKDDTIKYISTILSVIWKPIKSGEKMSGVEDAILKETIRKYYIHVNKKKLFPSLDGYVVFLNKDLELEETQEKLFDKKVLSLMLRDYTNEGEYSFLLNSKSNMDITNDSLIAFDMEAASKAEYFPVVIVIVLNLVAEKIKNRQGVTKKLIIDEGFDFLQDEKMGEYIAYLYRTFRKKEGEVLLAAQDCKFIDACPPKVKDSILINSDTKILLDHSNAQDSYNDLKRILSITDDEIELLDSLQKGPTFREFYMKLGKKSGVFRNEVSPIANVAFDSREATVVALKELFMECGSTQGALNQYLENKSNENE